MKQQEILDTIAPCIRAHQAAGSAIEIEQVNLPSIDGTLRERIRITPGKAGAFGSMFISDFSAVCRENFIAFAIGAEANPIQPYILL